MLIMTLQGLHGKLMQCAESGNKQDARHKSHTGLADMGGYFHKALIEIVSQLGKHTTGTTHVCIDGLHPA